MPRPPKPRRIGRDPRAVYFKPQGVRLRSLGEVDLGRDELEALRLADLEGCSHEEVGEKMEVSRATAGRILAAARAKTAEALVRGLAIRIGGGHVRFDDDHIEDTDQTRSPEMPGRDKRGPAGEGPATGRGLGGCKGTTTEEQTNDDLGRGLGRGLGRAGRGRGRGRGFGPGDGTGNRGRGRGPGRGRGR